MRNIIRWPNKELATPARKVNFKTTDIDFEKFRRDCIVLCKAKNGVAIAGPQLGIPYRIFYLKSRDLIAINPIINELPYSVSTVTLEEGCLSYPKGVFKIRRPAHIDWEWFTPDQNDHREIAYGWDSRVIQHEIDHLNGLCIPDIAES